MMVIIKSMHPLTCISGHIWFAYVVYSCAHVLEEKSELMWSRFSAREKTLKRHCKNVL